MADNYPKDLKYTRDHEWVGVNGNIATIGVSYYAQDELGDIVYVELPEVGKSLSQFGEFGVVESVKTVSNLYSPCSGDVTEINKDVLSSPEKINDNPYDSGWLIKLKLADVAELDELMSASEYEDYLEELSAAGTH